LDAGGEAGVERRVTVDRRKGGKAIAVPVEKMEGRLFVIVVFVDVGAGVDGYQAGGKNHHDEHSCDEKAVHGRSSGRRDTFTCKRGP
jgi:hypothetical protein